MSNLMISVIVPVYNVEKYLERCVYSITQQTYKNLEIILINDGSTDNSGLLCDKLAKEDRRIKVVHKKNKGLSSARNVGLEFAKGEFIGFIDSDDWISRDMYATLMNLINKYKAEVAQIGYQMAYNFSELKDQEKERIKSYTGKDILQHYMTTTTTTGSYSVCRCVFEKGILSGIRFREGKINEDIDFKFLTLQKCKCFVESNQVMYFYFQKSDSISSGILKKSDFDLYDAAYELRKLTKNEEFGTIKFLGEVKEARTAFSLLSKIAYYGIDEMQFCRKEIINNLTKEHRKNLNILLKSPIPLSRKICAILLAINIKALKVPVQCYQKMRSI